MTVNIIPIIKKPEIILLLHLPIKSSK